MDLREKIVESVKKGVPKSETAHRFGVHRATVKRYCKQLDERGTLQPRKAPGKAPKLDEKARKLLLGDLEEKAMGRALGAVRTEDVRGFFAQCGYRVPAQQL
jgi:transposase